MTREESLTLCVEALNQSKNSTDLDDSLDNIRIAVMSLACEIYGSERIGLAVKKIKDNK